MAKKSRQRPLTGGVEERPKTSPLGQVYPTIARWASGYGWVEFGIDAVDRPFVRVLDEARAYAPGFSEIWASTLNR